MGKRSCPLHPFFGGFLERIQNQDGDSKPAPCKSCHPFQKGTRPGPHVDCAPDIGMSQPLHESAFALLRRERQGYGTEREQRIPKLLSTKVELNLLRTDVRMRYAGSYHEPLRTTRSCPESGPSGLDKGESW